MDPFELSNFPLFVICSVVSMQLVDYLLKFSSRLDTNGRWYIVHALANSFNVILTFNDLVFCLLNPLSIMNGPHNQIPMGISVGLHLHHIIINLYGMDIIDWLHHIISCFIMGMVGTYYLPGPIVNYIIFFICGLPGGIDYYLLAMKKLKMITPLTEKWLNVYLNMWIRVPGLLHSCSLAIVNYALGLVDCNPIALCLIAFANVFNGIYFATRVTTNYGETRHKINRIRITP